MIDIKKNLLESSPGVSRRLRRLFRPRAGQNISIFSLRRTWEKNIWKDMGYYFFHLSGNQAKPIYVFQELIHILGTAFFFPALPLLSFSIYISSNPPCFPVWVQITLVLGCRRSWGACLCLCCWYSPPVGASWSWREGKFLHVIDVQLKPNCSNCLLTQSHLSLYRFGHLSQLFFLTICKILFLDRWIILFCHKMGCCINPSNRGAAYLGDDPVIPGSPQAPLPVFGQEKHPVIRPSPIENQKPEKGH